MTADEFRELALALPEAEERSHMNHPDFRVKGKIFATLDANNEWGMVKLSTEDQALFSRTDPATFEPFPGGWAKFGCTKVMLPTADEPAVRQALLAAWRRTAPKTMHHLLEGE